MDLALMITLLSGVAFILGYFIEKYFKDKNKLIVFSIGFSFSIMILLIIFDLLPESIELLENDYLMIGGFALLGLLLLKGLDLFVPDHEHTSKHNEDHVNHIGFITGLALILHNLVEGVAVYSATQLELKTGLLMTFGVFCHNLPLGIQISSLMGKNKNKKLLLLFVLMLSSILGVLVINIFNINMTSLFLGALISVTIGMLLYILIFELLCEIKEHIKDKTIYLGLVFGILMFCLSMIL